MKPGPAWSVPPKLWGSRVDYDNWDDPYTPDDGIALHHGGSGDYPAAKPPYARSKEEAQLRAWENYHIDHRGWRGLAYGWGIGQTGNVYRIRGWNTYGAHTGDVDGDGIANNTEIIPFLVITSGYRHDLTPRAQLAIIRLRLYIETHAPDARYLYGHQEVQTAPTTCPGPKNMEYVNANRYLKDPLMPTLPLRIGDDNEDIRALKDMLNVTFGSDLDKTNLYDDNVKQVLADNFNITGNVIKGGVWENILRLYIQAVTQGGHDHDKYVEKGKNVVIKGSG